MKSYWSGAEQIRVARRMLDLILREKKDTLSAFRQAASETTNKKDIKTLAQMCHLGKGFMFARFQVEQELKEGRYFRPKVESLVDLVAGRLSLGTQVVGVEKQISEYVPKERRPYILVVGTLPGQERFLRSELFDLKFWSIGQSEEQLRQLVKAAAHTIVWVDKINHSADASVKSAGPYNYVKGGITSISRKIEQLQLH